MLYTLSQAHTDNLHTLLAQLSDKDALLFWQNGVLQAVKNPQIFANCPNVFVLENDLQARGLTSTLPTVSLAELVTLTEQFHPQIAL